MICLRTSRRIERWANVGNASRGVAGSWMRDASTTQKDRGMNSATLDDVLRIYGLENWGAGYFSINRDGHLAVHPAKGTLVSPTPTSWFVS